MSLTEAQSDRYRLGNGGLPINVSLVSFFLLLLLELPYADPPKFVLWAK